MANSFYIISGDFRQTFDGRRGQTAGFNSFFRKAKFELWILPTYTRNLELVTHTVLEIWRFSRRTVTAHFPAIFDDFPTPVEAKRLVLTASFRKPKFELWLFPTYTRNLESVALTDQKLCPFFRRVVFALFLTGGISHSSLIYAWSLTLG